MKSRIEEVRVVFEGWTRFVVARVLLPDGAKTDRAILDHGVAACVLAYNAEARTALVVSQPRAPLIYLGEESELIEAIAGRVENEEPAEAVRREAAEEAGLRLEALQHVATCWCSPGVSTERIALYVAEYAAAQRVAKRGGAASEHENIRVKELPLATLAAMAAQGRLTDMKTLLLVQALQLRRPDLFPDDDA